MKVLFLTQTGVLGPSSRYRVYQLLPALRALGIEGEASPAIPDDLYAKLYLSKEGDSKLQAFFHAWRARKRDLARLDHFDAVLVQKGVFPGLSACFEKKIARRLPIIFDFDDAIWLPRKGGSYFLRALHREGAVETILRRAAAVIAGNNFLADYARPFNNNVSVIPSAIDPTRYLKTQTSPSTTPQIGWIGSGTTLPYLKRLARVFQSLAVRPRIIASGRPVHLGFNMDFRQWTLETEQAELSQIEIGIAPLPDTPWERGKCGVKLLQYMACGIPVVASPVGVHKEMVRHGENGFLADTDEQWQNALSTLCRNPELRKKMGDTGRKLLEERYSLDAVVPRLAEAFRMALQR